MLSGMKPLFAAALLLCSFLATALCGAETAPADRPNILWIVSEDNGPFFGCYGDPAARTPNLDRLAARGVHFTRCFANAPVCAVMRSSWILGVPAITTGTHHMRSRYRVPATLATYPQLLKQAGYFVTNNAKTDYNTSSFEKEIWDQCGPKATYHSRPAGRPFFAVFNLGATHESQIFDAHYPKTFPAVTTPADGIKLPPYQANTPEMVLDWRRAYDRIADMDREVGRLLAELQASGEADNTIVVYNSDHAGITPRSKRYLYDSGTHVPLIIAVPAKWQAWAAGPAGSASDRLVQFLDLPKTFMALARADIPAHVGGRRLLGPDAEPAPDQLLLFSGRFDQAPDMRRGLTDGRWKYIRNYEPDRSRFQMLTYPWAQAGMRSQWREFQAGRLTPVQAAYFQAQPTEELYDTQSDPHETNNLAASAAHAARLDTLRRLLDTQLLAVRDTGFIPEPQMAGIDADAATTIYAYAQSPARYPLEKIMALANLAGRADIANLPGLRENLAHAQPEMRYWAAVGLRALGVAARPAEKDLEKALADPEPSVRITAALALGNLGRRDEVTTFLLREARTATLDAHAAWALDGLRYLDLTAAGKKLTREEAVKGPISLGVYENLIVGGSMRRPPDE